MNSEKGKRRRGEGRRLRYVRRRGKGPNPGFVIFAAVALVIVAVSIFFIVRGRSKPAEQPIGTEPVQSTAAETEAAPARSYFTSVTVPADDVFTGDLILVNYSHEYVFPEKTDLLNIYENKTDDFKVAYANYMLERRVLDAIAAIGAELKRQADEDDLTVNSAYRTYDEQCEIYEYYKELNGPEYAALYVADPGKSEHHTGLAVDLTIVRDDGSAIPMTQDDDYELICELLTSHGFIRRYPPDKKEVTKIESEPWHYRYIGLPHSYIVEKTGLCLEEYEEFLKNYSAEGEILFLGGDGVLTAVGAESVSEVGDGYAVYYVPASEGEQTEIPVPTGASYSVSGNNEDGFIVTAKIGGASASVVASVDEPVRATALKYSSSSD